MTISEVQTNFIHNSGTVTLPANVTAGNSVLVSAVGFNNSGSTISTNTITYAGSSTGATTKATDDQSGAANPNIYAVIWLLSNLSGDSNSFTITYNNGFASHTVATEFSGLGASPVIGPVNQNAAQGTSAVTSGSLTALSQSAAVAGIAGTSGSLGTAPGSPWTSTTDGNDCWGWLIGSNGDTPVFTVTGGGNSNWAAAIAAVYPTAVSGLPAMPLVVPSLAAIQASTW